MVAKLQYGHARLQHSQQCVLGLCFGFADAAEDVVGLPVRMRNLRFRYGRTLPEILHGVDLDIKGGEKVAIVGRTGACLRYAQESYPCL